MIKIGDIIISNLFIGSTQVSKAYLGNVKVWPITTETNYVTFTAQQDNSSIGLNQLSTNQTLEYSTDTVTWNTFNTSTNISLNTGDKVYVRGKLSANNTNTNYTRFTMSGKIAASGNTNSLWNYEDLNASLKPYCGYMMFQGCGFLTTAPKLPATKLASNCYSVMFDNCSSLISAPELPATELATSCYSGMFRYCSSLTDAPKLPATMLASNCYNVMFFNCTGITDAPKLPANTLANGCYNSMFWGCTSLTTVSELPVTTLTSNCYRDMFRYCTNLNYIKCLAVNGINTNNSTENWVSGVAATGTFVKNSAATWNTGVNGIPSGWTVQDA